MMWARLAGGDQQPGGLPPNGNIQQTVTVDVAEFAALFSDELNAAESVNFQANLRQA